ncbi:hypothetical protein [Pseudoduganella namucuonensis]|uniref:Uncharacterized protein n=1 Tax=Pseudoduganella namucuonensis TaxID=1035707 RepID=A0A1I7GXH2_9BURK|nr:hypothetical protein [Pseudoduganella namucuonensis]SFU53095.1 hypothetical protein SAMN05216552_1004177 [Pseudoduganella namucuonensis]
MRKHPPRPPAPPLALLLALAASPGPAAGADASAAAPESELYTRYNLFAFGVAHRQSGAERGFNLLALPRNQQQLDLRPDFGWTGAGLELGLKPRLSLLRSETDMEFGLPGRQTYHASHAYINEGYVRYRAGDAFTFIAGRENLQWGPAALLSASNPFNPNNGKSNPNVEQPGMDYVRAVYIPSGTWTLSLIANTGRGRLGREDRHSATVGSFALGAAAALAGAREAVADFFDATEREQTGFDRTYAAKLDYTGDGHYASLLWSHRKHGLNRTGAFAGWNASEALLVYGEASVAQRRASQAPQRRDYRALLGGSYTLESGATFTAEYFRNNAGCRLTPVALCAGTALPQPRLPVLRRRYQLLQYVDTKVGGNTNLLLRAIRNADDHSHQASLHIEYELGGHTQLYLTPTLSRGKAGSEFGTLPRRSLFYGLSYTF